MPEYAKMYPCKQDSEYMPRVLNMPKFWIWQSSQYDRDRVLNMWVLRSVLNMPEYALAEFWIDLGF